MVGKAKTMIVIYDQNNEKIEFSQADGFLYFYKDGQYLGCEHIRELTQHMFDEDAKVELETAETLARRG